MMVVRSVNNVFPDYHGNVTVQSDINLYDSNGLVNHPTKVFVGTAVTTGSDGVFSLNIESASFTSVLNIQLTVMAGSFSQANAPLSANVGTISSTSITGKAFKVTSAGLLTAMQQTPVESGTIIQVLIVGY